MPLQQLRDDGAVHVEMDAATLKEQLRLLSLNRMDLPINLIVACIVSSVCWRIYPHWILLGWLASFSLVLILRLLSRLRYRSLQPNSDKPLHWGWIFTTQAAATGCLWGLTASVVLVTSDSRYHLFVIFLLGGIMAGGVVSNAVYLPGMYAFMLPTILPIIATLFTRADRLEIEMAILVSVFALFLLSTGRAINRTITREFRLRIAQEHLMSNLRASEAAMADAQAMAHVGSWELDLQTNHSVVSAETLQIFGDPTFAPSYETILARSEPADRPMLHEAYAELLNTGRTTEIDHRIVMDDGTIKYVHEIVRTASDAEGRVIRLFGTTQDVTERRQSEDKLQFANILLTTEMEASPDGILVVDRNRSVISFNRRFNEIWGVPAATLLAGMDHDVLTSGLSLVKYPVQFEKLVQHIYDHPRDPSHDEFEMLDGRFIDRRTVTLTTSSGSDLGRIWFFRDVTESKLVAAAALLTARLDPLTKLTNRGVFVEELQHAFARAERDGIGFAVVYLDLDHFKDVNDTLGHPTGDFLLQEVAERLRFNTREADIVARFGGDEFAVLLTGVNDPSSAAMLADKLIKALALPYLIEGSEIYSGASIGIDLFGPVSANAENLLSHADVALYRAKAGGRGGYRFFTDDMDKEVRTQVSLGTELHEALKAGQLFLLYQPQISIDTEEIVGVEALVRWAHPQRGILTPDLFIPVAEKTGIVVKIGHWVLLTACRQAAAWHSAGFSPIRMAVNLSALQLKSPINLEADVAAVLAETHLPPHLLELELTETVLMNAAQHNSDILAQLRRIGVTIAIDDFGTGFSSLDYLHRMPADRLKIAQTFVRHLESTPGNATIIRATIGLARELGIMVIAEGVETCKEFEMLKSWGCAEVQGFYFAKPLAADEIGVLLRQPPALHQERTLTK